MMKNLSPRDRQVLIGGGVIVFFLLLVFGLITPLADMLNSMDSRFTKKQEQVEKARLLQADVAQVKMQLAQLGRKTDRRQEMSLFALIEKSSEQLGFRDNLVSMRPQSPSRR